MASDSGYHSDTSSACTIPDIFNTESDDDSTKQQLRKNIRIHGEKEETAVDNKSLNAIQTEYGCEDIHITQDVGTVISSGKEKRLLAWPDVPNDGKQYEWSLAIREGKSKNLEVPTYDWSHSSSHGWKHCNHSSKRFVLRQC